MIPNQRLLNYIGGEWRASNADEFLDVTNPATGELLAKTREMAKTLGLRVFLLEPLEDVDRPEHLPVWEKFSSTPSPLISIIIPTLNEEENIEACLASTKGPWPVERIVVDGESRDRTVEIARTCGAKVISSPPGRGRQMNLGAREAAGDFLLFLHADTRLAESPNRSAALTRPS